jgi:glutathione S-transferase
MLKLYYTPNTCALASHIALEQAGADYEAIRVDFAANEQRKPEYLAINPKGRVPSLITERGVLTETPAILVFIAQSHPDACLAPLDDAFALAQVQAFNSYLCSTVHVAHSHRMRGTRWADDPAAIAAMQRKVPQSVGECFELIEREMLKGPWVMGDAYSICDMYLFTLSQWLEGDGVDTGKLPRVMDHRRRMSEHPVVRKVLAAEATAR